MYGEIFMQVNKLCSVSDDPSEFSQDKDDVTHQAGKCARAERIRYLPGVNHVTYGQMPCGGCERSFFEILYPLSTFNSQSDPPSPVPSSRCNVCFTVQKSESAAKGSVTVKPCNKWPVHSSLTLVSDSRPSYIPIRRRAITRNSQQLGKNPVTVSRCIGSCSVAGHSTEAFKDDATLRDNNRQRFSGQVDHNFPTNHLNIARETDRRLNWRKLNGKVSSDRNLFPVDSGRNVIFSSHERHISNGMASSMIPKNHNDVSDMEPGNGSALNLIESAGKTCRVDELHKMVNTVNESSFETDNKVCQTPGVCASKGLEILELEGGKESAKASVFVSQPENKACQTSLQVLRLKESSPRAHSSVKALELPQLRKMENKTCQTHVRFSYNTGRRKAVKIAPRLENKSVQTPPVSSDLRREAVPSSHTRRPENSASQVSVEPLVTALHKTGDHKTRKVPEEEFCHVSETSRTTAAIPASLQRHVRFRNGTYLNPQKCLHNSMLQTVKSHKVQHKACQTHLKWTRCISKDEESSAVKTDEH